MPPVENYQKVRVSPSGPTIASEGGFSTGRTWMWQGVATSTTQVPVPNPTSDYAQGLSPTGQEGEPLLVDIKPYAGSGLVYDIEVDASIGVVGTNGGMSIWVVGSNDSFATSEVLATNVLKIAVAPAAVPITETVRMHITDLGFSAGWKQVAVKFGFASDPTTSLIYTPNDVSLVITEYGTN